MAHECSAMADDSWVNSGRLQATITSNNVMNVDRLIADHGKILLIVGNTNQLQASRSQDVGSGIQQVEHLLISEKPM